ncbi:Tetratricopeptide repeat protein [compost metagenome]
MKVVVILLLCFSAFSSFGQDWKETLNEARKLYKKGNYKEALKYYKRAERLAPNDVDLSQEIGQTAYRANDFDTASEQFERQAGKAETKEKVVRARTSLGESRMKQQDYESAIDAYKDVLRLDSDNEQARQRLVEAKRLQKQKCKNKTKEQEQDNKDQQDKKDQDQKKNDQNQKDQPNQKNQKEDKDQGQSKNNQQNQNQQDQKGEQKKLQDKETERKLDEFSKQELSTKKRLDGSKGTTGGKKARKDW